MKTAPLRGKREQMAQALAKGLQPVPAAIAAGYSQSVAAVKAKSYAAAPDMVARVEDLRGGKAAVISADASGTEKAVIPLDPLEALLKAMTGQLMLTVAQERIAMGLMPWFYAQRKDAVSKTGAKPAVVKTGGVGRDKQQQAAVAGDPVQQKMAELAARIRQK